MLIPTQSKGKVHPRWSYPVGSEIISGALSELPQYDSIYLRFLMPDEPQMLVSFGGADYSPPHMTMLERNWMIDIFAVPSLNRAFARASWTEEILPNFVEWLARPRPPIWHETHQGLQVTFDSKFERIVYKELEVGR